MSNDADELIEVWGRPTFTRHVPTERFTQYSNRVPGSLLELWHELGFAGFSNGLWWICDPAAWQPAVDAWTRDLELPMGGDQWLAISRTAFGNMQLWGQRTGASLVIVPYRGWIFPNDRSRYMSSSEDRNDQIYAAFISRDKGNTDIFGDDGVSLFDQILPLRGPIGPDNIYGFVPALALGGSLRADHAEIFDASMHLQLLSDVTPRTIMADTTREQLWKPLQANQTGLAGETAKLLTDDPTDDAGWPADLPPDTIEVLIVDDQPSPTLTLRVHPPGDSSRLARIRFDQLAVREK